MAVASPYAVFRAVDVIWPPQAPSVEAVAHHVPTAAAPVRRPRKRRVKGAVQGELFPVVAGMPGGLWV
ncbi:hypothetical protein KUL97_08520 [Synechococcus sp. HK05]|uniref:hypothetical protein n=1 Tax=Synechococcus sp. HK05 TaxID=2725975 RepID=UPI001C395559|nr:hypothetical protein [Synechococcus sp. HK05]MBV2351747.1 hypothetical protein [Synechococcus sp. HK05]